MTSQGALIGVIVTVVFFLLASIVIIVNRIYRSTNTHESSTNREYNVGLSNEAISQDDGIYETEKPPHGTSIDPPIVSNHSPEPLKRKDSGRGETTPDPKSGRSRTGSVSSSQSHTSKDETTSSKTPPSESSVHMDQTSSKSDKDSSQDVNTSHPSQYKTTQHTESGSSRTGSHSPAIGNRRNELLSPEEMHKSIFSLPAGTWAHDGLLNLQNRSTDTRESYTNREYNVGLSNEAISQDDGIFVTEKPPHGTSTAPPFVSNHSPEPLKRKDSGKHETTSGTKSGRSRTGSVSSSQSHTSKDESKSSESSDSESSVHTDQISLKSDKDSSQDVNTSHPSQDETTQHTESDTSRTGSHSPANGNRRNEKLSHKEMFNSITSLPAGTWAHDGPLDQQRGQTDREGPGNGASNENSASGLTGTLKKYLYNFSKSASGYLKDSILGFKENSKGSPSEDQVTPDSQIDPGSTDVDQFQFADGDSDDKILLFNDDKQ